MNSRKIVPFIRGNYSIDFFSSLTWSTVAGSNDDFRTLKINKNAGHDFARVRLFPETPIYDATNRPVRASKGTPVTELFT